MYMQQMSDYGSFIDIFQFGNKLQFGIIPLDILARNRTDMRIFYF